MQMRCRIFSRNQFIPMLFLSLIGIPQWWVCQITHHVAFKSSNSDISVIGVLTNYSAFQLFQSIWITLDVYELIQRMWIAVNFSIIYSIWISRILDIWTQNFFRFLDHNICENECFHIMLSNSYNFFKYFTQMILLSPIGSPGFHWTSLKKKL